MPKKTGGERLPLRPRLHRDRLDKCEVEARESVELPEDAVVG